MIKCPHAVVSEHGIFVCRTCDVCFKHRLTDTYFRHHYVIVKGYKDEVFRFTSPIDAMIVETICRQMFPNVEAVSSVHPDSQEPITSSADALSKIFRLLVS